MKKSLLFPLMALLTCSLVACGETPPTTSSEGNQNPPVQEEVTTSGNKMPTFVSEGSLKKDDGEVVTLPKLDDQNYKYEEVNNIATFTYPKEGDALYEVRFVIVDEITIDSKTYNNVTCNFANLADGVYVSYFNRSFDLNIVADKEVTLTSINADYLTISGTGILNLTSIYSTEILKVNGGSNVNVTNKDNIPVTVKNALFAPESNVNIVSNKTEGLVVNGNCCAFGKMVIKDDDRSKDNNGVLINGTSSAFKVDITSEVTIDGYDYGITSTTGGKIYRASNVSWDDVSELDEEGNQYRPNVLPGKSDTKFPVYNNVFILKVVYSNYRWNISEANL